jgi:hypothetical protein
MAGEVGEIIVRTSIAIRVGLDLNIIADLCRQIADKVADIGRRAIYIEIGDLRCQRGSLWLY